MMDNLPLDRESREKGAAAEEPVASDSLELNPFPDIKALKEERGSF